MSSDSGAATAPVQTEPCRSAPIAELSTGFPTHDLVHEIAVRGGCDWATLMALGDTLSRCGAPLESLSARRYGTRGELITCRVRALDDVRLQNAVNAIRKLSGVTSVAVAHLLTSRR